MSGFSSLQVKTWFQNRRMKHKKQLRKSQDDPKGPGADEGAEQQGAGLDVEALPSDKAGAESRKGGVHPPAFLLEETEDEVDIIEGAELCEPPHLI